MPGALYGLSVTTMEKRFGLSGTLVAMPPTASTVVGMIVTLLVGAVIRRTHKGLWVTFSGVVFVFSITLIWLPHFFLPLYTPTNTTETTLLCNESSAKTPPQTATPTNYGMLVILSVSMIFLAAAGAIHGVAFPVYIDDNVRNIDFVLFQGEVDRINL